MTMDSKRVTNIDYFSEETVCMCLCVTNDSCLIVSVIVSVSMLLKSDLNAQTNVH